MLLMMYHVSWSSRSLSNDLLHTNSILIMQFGNPRDSEGLIFFIHNLWHQHLTSSGGQMSREWIKTLVRLYLLFNVLVSLLQDMNIVYDGIAFQIPSDMFSDACT